MSLNTPFPAPVPLDPDGDVSAHVPVVQAPLVESVVVDSDPMDIVPTSEAKPSRKGKDNRFLRLHREKVKARERLRVIELARLVALDGLSFKDAAERMGMNTDHVRKRLWPQVKSLALADYATVAERERVGHFVVSMLTDVANTARKSMGEHAAYGAVAVQAGKALAEIFGLDYSAQPDAGVAATLAEVGEAVKRAAPLLAGNLEAAARIRALQATRSLGEG